MAHTFTMTRAQAERIHKLASSEVAAHKNWIASAVRAGDFERAQKLAVEVEKYEAIFAGFNLRSKEESAKARGAELDTDHIVRS